MQLFWFVPSWIVLACAVAAEQVAGERPKAGKAVLGIDLMSKSMRSKLTGAWAVIHGFARPLNLLAFISFALFLFLISCRLLLEIGIQCQFPKGHRPGPRLSEIAFSDGLTRTSSLMEVELYWRCKPVPAPDDPAAYDAWAQARRAESFVSMTPRRHDDTVHPYYWWGWPQISEDANGHKELQGRECGFQAPMSYGIAPSVVLPFMWLPGFLRARRRIRTRLKMGLCVACGCDLRATQGRCPECGAATKR